MRLQAIHALLLAAFIGPLGCGHTAILSANIPKAAGGKSRPLLREGPSLRAEPVDESVSPPPVTASVPSAAPHVDESPIAADIERSPVEPPADPVCTVRGTGRPFDPGCYAPVTIAARADGKEPIAVINAAHTRVTFDFIDESNTAWATIEGGGVRAQGYWPLAGETFRLRTEATALGGHAHLLTDTPVRIRWVSRVGLAVTTDDASASLDELDTRANCSAIVFDPFQGEPRSLPAPRGKLAIPRGESLAIRTEPDTGIAWTLKPLPKEHLFVNLQILAERGESTRVAFHTEHARFDVWVDTASIAKSASPFVEPSVGRGGCGSSGESRRRTHKLRRTVDALVAALPTSNGSANIQFTKGAIVHSGLTVGDWTAVTPAESSIAPAGNLSFWVPEDAID